MVAAGSLMIVLGMYGAYLAWRKKLDRPNTWYYRIMLWAISLPFIANTAGWIMTEIGRQPWTVFGYMRTEDSISPSVTSGQILFSLIAFTAIYAVLAVVMVYLFVKAIKKGPYADNVNDDEQSADPYGKEGYHAIS
ncbi:Cytochrome bd-II ubiquinol oxidase subunit 1 [compost metagenome]